MTNCPHCNAPGIRSWAKRWSSREAPVTCAACGRFSHVIASTGSGIPVATLFVVVAFSVLGAVVGDPGLGALGGIPFAVAYNMWAWRKAQMFPISSDVASSARKVGWFVNLLTVLGIIGS